VDLGQLLAEGWWNKAWDLVSEIRRDSASHLRSALEGDNYVPSSGERAAWAVFEMDLNTRLPKGSGRKKIKRPWAGPKPVYRQIPKALSGDSVAVARRAKLAAMF
jgi:hypothetical protein